MSVLGIDDLPDELLLQIFSRITDGLTLLDRIPAVCRRWKTVASEAAAWRGVTISVKASKWTSSFEKAVLERAPAVQSLRISVTESPTARQARPNHHLIRALNRLLVYHELSIEANPPQCIRQGYLELVWRSRHHLKRLAIVLDNTTKTNLGHSSVYVLSRLLHLEELTLYVQGNFVYERGQLQQCLPNLKSILLYEERAGSRQYDLIKDLLVVGLERAKFRPSFPPRPDLLKALTRCQKLTDLVVHWEFASVFRCLPALKSVHVDVTVDNPLLINKIGEAFASVYTPTLNDMHVTVFCEKYQGWRPVLDEACQKGVMAVKKRGFNGTITYLVW